MRTRKPSHSSPADHVVAKPCGVPSPKTAIRPLDDGTVLLPRCRHTTHQAHVLSLDAHIIGRVYGRDNMWMRSGGPWRPVHARPGAVSVFPAGFETWWDIPVANDFSGVVLPDDRLRAFSDEVGNGRRIDLAERVVVGEPTTSRIVDLLTRELDAVDRSSRLFFERGIDLLCAQLARVHCSNRKLGVWPRRRGLAAWQVRRVTGYMRDQLGQDIGLRELAQLVGLSRFHFCTAFRLATGQTPHEWLVVRRVGRAKELLADPSLRITDIALTVGYQTPSAFSASFRRLVRMTPTQYRRRFS